MLVVTNPSKHFPGGTCNGRISENRCINITAHSSGYLAVSLNLDTILDFFCVGVMYSGEYDACHVTLSVYAHWVSLKNMPGNGGNRTYDLWNTSPMLFQLSYAVRSVRVCDIS